MRVANSNFLSIEQLQDQYLNQKKSATTVTNTEGKSFHEILSNTQAAAREVRFSKHAAGRLADRNIELTKAQMERLQEGTAKAGQKGIKESLVIVDQLAFIVNVPSKMVVTAMQQSDAMENVFTNIDGAVII